MLRKAFVVCLIALAGQANAGPIHYFEAISGDLPGNGALTSFTLDAGFNTIAGQWGSDTGQPPCTVNGCFPDFDSFIFEVPSGLAVDVIALVFAPLRDVDWLTAFRIGGFFENIASDDAPLSFVFGALTPFGAGTYEVDHAFFSGNVGTLDTLYLWTLHATEATTPVPEPGTLDLLGTGLLALVWLRYRSRPH